MPIHVDKKSLVVQSNRLVEAKYRLSVEEQKIVKILVSQIQKDDEDFKNYEFRIKDLAELLDMGHSNTYGVLRGITKRLVSRVLEFYDQEKKEFIQASWLSGAKYKEGLGTVTLHFDPLLKPLLLQLQSYFTKYEIGQVLRFKGQYTIRFFEFRKSFLGRQKQEIVFELSELREVLGLQKNEYKIFRDFKNRVLEPARVELLEKTGKSFTWEQIRQGRGGKVTGIRFVFDGDGESESSPEARAIPPSRDTKKGEQETDHQNPAGIDRLIRLGVSPQKAQELAGLYAEPYILEKIALVESHPEYVKSAAGFVITALQEDWKDAKIEEQKRGEERRHEETAKRNRETRLRTIKQNFEMRAKNHALRQYEQLPVATQQQLKEEFLGTLSGIMAKRYVQKSDFGFEDPYYRAFVMKHKLSALTLEAYLQEAGLSLSPEETQSLQGL